MSKIGKSHTAWKRCLSILLAMVLIFTIASATGVWNVGATLYVDEAPPPGEVYFYAPETIYVNPLTNDLQYYVNNWSVTPNGANWGDPANGRGEKTNGWVHFYCEGATNATIRVADDGGTGFAAANGGPTSAGNMNVDLPTHMTSTKVYTSGLVKWEVNFQKNGANYRSYCYTYIYVPDARAISGSTARGHAGISGDNGFNSYFSSGIFIVGSHYYPTAPSGGTRSPSNQMQLDLWGTFDTSKITSMLDYAANSAGGITLEEGWAATGTTTYQTTQGQSNGGLGYIQVDSSRYSNLSQVPQLSVQYAVSEASLGGRGRSTIQVVTGKGTGMDNGMWPYNTANGGTWMENPLGGNTAMTSINPERTVPKSGLAYKAGVDGAVPATGTSSVRVYAGYHWHMKTNSTITSKANVMNKTGTSLQYTARNKKYLREKLQEEIQSGLQLDNMQDSQTYIEALENMALALCQPDYAFRNSAGNDIGDTALGSDGDPGSMPNQVKSARALMTRAGPFQAKASYRSTVLPVEDNVLAWDSTNMMNYRLGDNVYAKYDGNKSISGYRKTPVAVNVPGSFTAGEQDQLEYSNINKSFDRDSLTIPGVASGLAPNHPTNAVNLNTQLKADLEWVWWMEPIEYKIQYLPGDHASSGSMDPMVVQYDTDGQLLPNGFTPQAGWTFAGWSIQGDTMQPGEIVRNLTTVDGRMITATALWKKADAQALTLTVDPNGGTPGGLVYISDNVTTDTQYGDLTRLLPNVTKAGYNFDGWYFDYGDWTKKWETYGQSYMNQSDPGLTIYAKWKARTSTVNYDKNGGSGITLQRQIVEYDGAVNLHNPSAADLYRTGYTFLGWMPEQRDAGPDPLSAADYNSLLTPGINYTHDELFGAGAVESEITLYAVWQAKTFALEFNVNWHNPSADIEGDDNPPAGLYATQDIVYGEEYGLYGWPSNPERFGWTFVGWYLRADSSSGTSVVDTSVFQMSKSDLDASGGTIKLYARWLNGASVPTELILEANGGKFSDGSSGNRIIWAGQGTSYPLVDYLPTRQGFSFQGWEILDGSCVLNDDQTSVVLNTKSRLRAIWEPIYYTVSFRSNYPDGTNDIEEHTNLNMVDGNPVIPLPATFSFPGRTLQGYSYSATAALPDILPNVGSVTLSQLLNGAGIADGDTTKTDVVLYGIWAINGGIPEDPEGEFPGLPTEPGEEPPEEPYTGIPDPDGKDGYIVMYFIVPKDVTVPGGTPGYRFLSYGKSYGAMPAAYKSDGQFLEWRIIKYGRAGSEMPPLGDSVVASDKVDHEYSIWVAPFFKPGYAVRYIGNGGTIKENGETNIGRIVYPGETYGEAEGGVPEAERKHYKFIGWFTAPEGGTQVTADTLVGSGGEPSTLGSLVPIDNLPVVDTLYAHWEQSASDWDIFIDGLPDWVVNVFLGVGLGILGYGSASAGTLAALSIGTIIGASILGFFLLPLALLLPFLFPVVAALMPVWWPIILL